MARAPRCQTLGHSEVHMDQTWTGSFLWDPSPARRHLLERSLWSKNRKGYIWFRVQRGPRERAEDSVSFPRKPVLPGPGTAGGTPCPHGSPHPMESLEGAQAAAPAPTPASIGPTQSKQGWKEKPATCLSRGDGGRSALGTCSKPVVTVRDCHLPRHQIWHLWHWSPSPSTQG